MLVVWISGYLRVLWLRSWGILREKETSTMDFERVKRLVRWEVTIFVFIDRDAIRFTIRIVNFIRRNFYLDEKFVPVQVLYSSPASMRDTNVTSFLHSFRCQCTDIATVYFINSRTRLSTVCITMRIRFLFYVHLPT